MRLKKRSKEARHFYNSFVSTICITLCPVLLISGILISDYNTRKTGFSDIKPAVYYEYDGDLNISIFGQEIFISEEVISDTKNTAYTILNFIPPQARILSGLSSAIDSLFYFILDLVV